MKEEMDRMAALFEKAQQETRHHFDVVAEDLKSDIWQIAEGHTVVVEKIDALDIRVARVEERMDGMEAKIAVLDQKVESLDRKFDDFVGECRASFDDLRSTIKFSYAEG